MFKREELVLTDDVRVIQFEMSAGEQLAWHYHTHIKESIFCLQGKLRVLSDQSPQNLLIGQQARFDAGQAHALQNASDKPAIYLLIQHGQYDFIECDSLSSHH